VNTDYSPSRPARRMGLKISYSVSDVERDSMAFSMCSTSAFSSRCTLGIFFDLDRVFLDDYSPSRPARRMGLKISYSVSDVCESDSFLEDLLVQRKGLDGFFDVFNLGLFLTVHLGNLL
jgi:hypothetical protein